MTRSVAALAAVFFLLVWGAFDVRGGNAPTAEARSERARTIAARTAARTDAPAASAKKEAPDPWLWLEERQGDRALRWVREHNQKTRQLLESDPRFKPMREQALAVMAASDRIPYGSHRNGFIHNFWRDEDHPRGIWRRATLESWRSASPEWEIILDIDRLAAIERVSWVLNGVNCLPPAFEHCMVALSRGGADRTVFREWNAATRTFVTDGFNINEGYSGVAWLDRDTVLVTSAYGRSALALLLFGYRPNVRIWKRGTPLEEAKPLVEANVNEGITPAVSHRPEGTVAVILRRLDFYDALYSVLRKDGTAVQLPLPIHADLGGVFKGRMLFILRKAWTPKAKAGAAKAIPAGSLIAFDLNAFLETGTLPDIDILYTPDDRSTIHGVTTSQDAVFLSVLSNVASRLFILRLENGAWSMKPAELPGNGTATVVTDNFSDVVFVAWENYLTPDRLSELDIDTGELTLLKSLPPRFDANGLTTQRFEATSKDGTRVPYFFVGPERAARKGPLPTLVYGYGGFGISLTPSYMPEVGKLWLEKGGAFAVASIRGGGEFGPDWHEAGLGTNRPRSFEDFTAVADDLVARGLTSPRRLGIMGGSNGGLLVGAAFTRRPELYHAVLCLAPVLDMIRYVKLPPGQHYTTEYGNPDIPAEREILLGYSPYHNLRKDARYPQVFFQTSTNDDRVHPGHARKMAARMEELGHEVFYYEDAEGGHSGSATILQSVDSLTLQYVYLVRKLMDGETPAATVAQEAVSGGAGGEKTRAAAGSGGE